MKRILFLVLCLTGSLASYARADDGDFYNPVISNYNSKYDSYPMSRRSDQQVAQATPSTSGDRLSQLNDEYNANTEKFVNSTSLGDFFGAAIKGNQLRRQMALETVKITGKSPVVVSNSPRSQNCTVNTNYSSGYSAFSNVNCY
ncbi:hypothetical protein [Burkholderia multivorans]|uniref:hypothetical protein n=1 Tax=Burkholderia multivorans TaxID=87883 RepID=UPI0021BEF4AE|nr:hypothetical protein [Burkholderia multivorans]